MRAKAKKLDIIREAIDILGYIPVPGPNGITYEVRAITGTAPNGAWVTSHPTADMMGYVRIKRSAHEWIVRIAHDIIARREQILAQRESNARAFRER